LYKAFSSGGREVINHKDLLDKINVFPVADSDTGENMAYTMKSLIEKTDAVPSVEKVTQAMADATLSGAKGNSGLIFAQFVQGISQSTRKYETLSTLEFARTMEQAVDYTYRSLTEPIEGTILTVMREWSEELGLIVQKRRSFVDLISDSISVARKSLAETPNKLRILKEKGVVDAGGKGFVIFLEGMAQFLDRGKVVLDNGSHQNFPQAEEPVSLGKKVETDYRYCTEVELQGKDLAIDEIKSAADQLGDSVVVAGSKTQCKIHTHTDRPACLVELLRAYGQLGTQKVDDMKLQTQMQKEDKPSVALVTDSACDLPAKILENHRIHVVPLTITFEEHQYLDKQTLVPDQFYKMVDDIDDFPRTSQPSADKFSRLYSILREHYQSVISVHLSSRLSGTYQAAKIAAQEVDPQSIHVIDSRQVSTALGLVTLRLAEGIRKGLSVDQLQRIAEQAIDQSRILVSVKDLKYMVRGGRVSPLKGLFAKLLNLKPIISLDSQGASELYGKAFRFSTNINKIIDMMEEARNQNPLRYYSIGHVNAPSAAEDLTRRLKSKLGQEPEYIMNISPMIGAHAGLGAVAVSYLTEE
ncbi:MAG: DAK2 domain-containing protein, partial [Candidatus Bipolaricaulota bacterium]